LQPAWFRKRWRTQWNVISNVNRRSKWIIKILNAYCATLLRFIFATCIWERVEFIISLIEIHWAFVLHCSRQWLEKKSLSLQMDDLRKKKVKRFFSQPFQKHRQTNNLFISLSFKRLTCWTKAFY